MDANSITQSTLYSWQICLLVFACAIVCLERIRGASGMAKSTTMTVRLKPEVSERLEMLARDTKRSKAYLASEAIEAYVELNSWQVAHIKGHSKRPNRAFPEYRTRRLFRGWNRGGP